MTINATPSDAAANSYVDLAYASAYFASRLGSESWNGAASEVRESSLIQATTHLDAVFDWEGEYRTDEDQALMWPRVCAHDRDGFVIPDDEIPENVKKAQCELALFFITNGGYTGESRDVDRIRIGTLMLDFDNNVAALPIPTVVTELLRGFGAYKGSGKSGNLNVPLYRV
jgi:hypothetical protein